MSDEMPLVPFTKINVDPNYNQVEVLKAMIMELVDAGNAVIRERDFERWVKTRARARELADDKKKEFEARFNAMTHDEQVTAFLGRSKE